MGRTAYDVIKTAQLQEKWSVPSLSSRITIPPQSLVGDDVTIIKNCLFSRKIWDFSQYCAKNKSCLQGAGQQEVLFGGGEKEGLHRRFAAVAGVASATALSGGLACTAGRVAFAVDECANVFARLDVEYLGQTVGTT